MSKIRILVADDHELIRKGLRKILKGQPDLEIVAEAQDGLQAVELAEKHEPDIVLMDIATTVQNSADRC
jgi:DNA-binding NarL/FixJ family response regulator